MYRTEINVTTNEISYVPLTPEEIAYAEARKAEWDIEEAARQSQLAERLARAQEIINNLPDWATIEAAIDSANSIVALRAVVKKIARVLYIKARLNI